MEEPVEFEELPVGVQGVKKFTYRFRGIYGVCLITIKNDRKITTCKPVGLGNMRILTDYVQDTPQTLNKFKDKPTQM